MNLVLPGAVGVGAPAISGFQATRTNSPHTLHSRYTSVPNPAPATGAAPALPTTHTQQQQQKQTQQQNVLIPFTDWSLREIARKFDIFDVYDLPRSDTDDDNSHQSDSELQELSARYYPPPTGMPMATPSPTHPHWRSDT